MNAQNEIIATPEVQAKSQTEELNYAELREQIINLDTDDTLWREKGKDYQAKGRQELVAIKTKLDDLKSQYQNDPDYQKLVLMWQDLQNDYQKQRKLNLDTSLGQIVEPLIEKIQRKGIQRYEIAELPNRKLQKLAIELQALGIEPEFIVPALETDAPTVILMLQAHSNPGMDTEIQQDLGVTSSQHSIVEYITAIQQSGLTKTVFGEGIPKGEMIDVKTAQQVQDMGYFQAKAILGDRLDLYGFDDMPFVKKSVVEITDPNSSYARQTVNNITLASNLVQELETRKTDTSIVVFGAGHEKEMDSYEEHPFPLSKAVAYTGANVVVIDTAQGFTEEALNNLLAKKPDALKNVALAMKQAVSDG